MFWTQNPGHGRFFITFRLVSHKMQKKIDIIKNLNAYINSKLSGLNVHNSGNFVKSGKGISMSETRYLISDASKKVDVEAHVLRYWEEELEVTIPRNELGHRYYTDLHIRLFRQVKELKERGYQLKAIKSVLPKLYEIDNLDEISIEPDLLMEEDVMKENTKKAEAQKEEPVKEETSLSEVESVQHVVAEDKMEQFQAIMTQIIGQALASHNDKLSDSISENVSDKVVKELDYLMRIKEEQEDERFKKLDETLRAYQKGQKSKAEAAATRIPFFQSRKNKKFGRNGNKLQ